jgi:hypothetical protein
MPEIEAEGRVVGYDRFPDTCPICHHGIEPRCVTGAFTGAYDSIGTYLELVFKCPRRGCSRLFIGRYAAPNIESDLRSGMKSLFRFKQALPFTLKPPNLYEEVKKLSPNFVEICGQTAAAEQSGLDQIAGVGYRKALEFLVKDYCIYRHPDKAEEIKAKFLDKCIKTYVDDANIKDCAELATWLGNDETHYVRRWEDKDIKDLKALINLTITWIQTNLLTEKYRKEMKKQ